MNQGLATTQWSRIVEAREGSDTEARRALEELCRIYWRPVYSFVRHLGASPDEARDITQSYFLELMEKDFLADVDAEKGRFRSFLFTSVRHFFYHEREKARALKRGGATSVLSWDIGSAEDIYANRPAGEPTPEEVFEHRWALTVVGRAMKRLEDESTRSGHEREFEQLRPYLTSSEHSDPYRDAAAALDMTEGAIKVAVHRLRKRFAECLRAELRETVLDLESVDEELRSMLSALSP